MCNNFFKLIIVSAVICLVNFNCKHNQSIAPTTGFPPAVNDIIVTKCSITGCHNGASSPGAAYLDLSSWTSLFKGATGGAIVIPYRSDQSWLCFFTNTNTANGPALQPSMPYNQPPLSTTDYQTLVNWIDNGAPDINGNIAFCCDPNRAKIYCTNQGCDLVTVFDANTQLAMRYVNVGNNNKATNPHQVKISPDGQYWYVVFLDGEIIQKFSAVTDSLIGNITINPVNQSADWTSICILPDGNHAFAASWVSDGELVYLDLNKLTVLRQFPGLSYPHAIHYYRNNLYVTSQYGNVIYKYTNIDSLTSARFPPSPKEIVIAPGEYPNFNSEYDPHEMAFSYPDSAEYFVTCENSNQVRVFQTSNDSLIAIIKTGVFPQEIVVSTTTPYAYVTCTNDPSSYPLTDGSVTIFNYKTNTWVANLQDGLWQPHGITLDETHKLAYVLSENYTTGGPAPHHPSACGGKNGYVMLIDMNTLNFVPHYKDEISVFPYSAAYRQ